MKLSDVMSSMGLSVYAEAALLLFVAVFAGVAVGLVLGGRSVEALRLLPLQDDPPRRRPVRPEEQP